MNQVKLPNLGTVQQTMLIPLYARAAEYQHPVPIIRDPKAVEIANSLQFDFESLRRFPRTLLGCCVRAQVVNAWIRDFLSKNSSAVVVEIGPGMDTTFERVDDGNVLWYEVDLPDAVEIRRNYFEEDERRRTLSGSILSDDWIEQVRGNGRGSYLFQAAGVLMYFSEEEVRQLFTMVADEFPGALFVFDACTPWTLRNAPRWEAALKVTDAEFRWGIDDPRAMGDWDTHFHVLAVEYHVDQHPHRWPMWVRIARRFLPAIRQSFSLNLARLG